jgi:hypothetical protein
MKARFLVCIVQLMCVLVLASVSANAQSAPTVKQRKDIPTIAKAANGAIVSIVMSDKDGKPLAQGTGFLVSKDGLILTNYHVIAEGSSAVVKLPDGAFYVVDGLLAFDKARDIAVIKARGQNFRTLALGDSDRVRVGDEVVAIGNPLSLESTVSNGIVSGMRTVREEGGKFLQITAPISPGSSGGSLFNMAGEVIGITTMYLKGGENLNFAIPINDVKPLLEADSSKLQAFPDESKSVKHDENAPPSTSKTENTLTAVEFMGRMTEPEHRDILQGVLEGAELRSANGPSITIFSKQPMLMAVIDGVTHKKGYAEFTYAIASDGGKYKQKDYPRYMSFALGDIDPSSPESKEGGYDPSVLAEFFEKHPRCEASPECDSELQSFLKSAPRLTVVAFHTTDLRPLIEQGGCSGTSGCGRTDTTARVVIFFQSKDRAERFVTALTYAVKLGGGKPDLFPPTR